MLVNVIIINIHHASSVFGIGAAGSTLCIRRSREEPHWHQDSTESELAPSIPRPPSPVPRHGPARPDHRHNHAGENDFGHTDGPVEPDHDVNDRCRPIRDTILVPMGRSPAGIRINHRSGQCSPLPDAPGTPKSGQRVQAGRSRVKPEDDVRRPNLSHESPADMVQSRSKVPALRSKRDMFDQDRSGGGDGISAVRVCVR